MDADKYKRNVLEATPERLYPLLEGGYRTLFPGEDPLKRESVPESLRERSVRDVSVVPDRRHLLADLPHGGRVAEVGVAEGEFSAEILSVADPDTLYLIDSWDSVRHTEAALDVVRDRFEDEIDRGDVEIIKARSEDALETFEDGYFDWIYIDTSHTYEQTRIELELGREKVRNGGVIAGHDYCLGNGGVVPAVHEFCSEHGWEMTSLSQETDGYWSFALAELPAE